MVYCGEHKMSKSLGNMIFICDLLNICSADSLRLYLLSHHYRQVWNFERRELAAMRATARKLARSLSGVGDASEAEVIRWGEPMLAAMSDDLDTTTAIAELRRLVASEEPGAMRAAKALGERVLGLRFQA